MRVLHISTVHKRTDVRIFRKQVVTLALQGYDMSLLIFDGNGDCLSGGVKIFDGGKFRSRLRRMAFGWFRVWRFLSGNNEFDVIHFHDPELLFLTPIFRFYGRNVIYDSHEDLMKQIQSKPYIPSSIRFVVAKSAGHIERILSSWVDYVVCVSQSSCERFRSYGRKAEVITNAPILDGTGDQNALDLTDRLPKDFIVYVGAVSYIRGALEMLHIAAELENGVKLLVVGSANEHGLRSALEDASNVSGANMVFLGQRSAAEVKAICGKAKAGIIFFHPVPNHLDAVPNKLYEYMAMGLPIFSSRFGAASRTVVDVGAGEIVDITNTRRVAAQINSALVDSAKLSVSESGLRMSRLK